MMWSAARPLREEGEGVLRRRGGALAHGDALEREHRRRRGRSLGAVLLARAAAAAAAARLRLRLGRRLRIGESVMEPVQARAEQCRTHRRRSGLGALRGRCGRRLGHRLRSACGAQYKQVTMQPRSRPPRLRLGAALRGGHQRQRRLGSVRGRALKPAHRTDAAS